MPIDSAVFKADPLLTFILLGGSILFIILLLLIIYHTLVLFLKR